jgi:hypothetical protein
MVMPVVGPVHRSKTGKGRECLREPSEMATMRNPPKSIVGPPMEPCVGFDDVGLIGWGRTSSVEGVGEVVEGFEGGR